MTDLPEVGTEWVHRETLIVVTVLAADDDDGFVSYRVTGLSCTGVCETALWHEEHIQNEPVSLEVLERLGCEVRGNHADMECGLSGHLMIRRLEISGEGGVRLRVQSPLTLTFTPLVPLETTANVLRLMRVFGLEVKA